MLLACGGSRRLASSTTLFWLFLAIAVAPTIISQVESQPNEVTVKILHGPSRSRWTKCDVEEQVRQDHFVTLHYNVSIDESSKTGTKGQVVDTTTYQDQETDFNQPMMFRMGDKSQGYLEWAENLLGLCEGDRVRLILPCQYVYGSDGNGDLVPPDATLRLDVDVLGADEDHELSYKRSLVTSADKMFATMDKDRDGLISLEEMEGFLEVPDDYPNREEFIRQHFELSDYDKDGFVTLEEFKAILLNFQGVADYGEL